MYDTDQGRFKCIFALKKEQSSIWLVQQCGFTYWTVIATAELNFGWSETPCQIKFWVV